MTASSPDQLDLSRLRGNALRARVLWFEELASTQDRAQQLSRSSDLGPLPLLVVSEQQTSGRGRGANRWWTGRGSLAFSLLFDPDDWGLARGPAPERSLVAGVAVVDTIAPLIAPVEVGLHWPNDVFARGKKVSGVLIDVLPDGKHIVGIGINVNNSLAAAPAEVQARATSLAGLVGHAFDRTAILLQLLENLQTAMREFSAAPAEFGRRFDELCMQRGRELTLEISGELRRGLCAGIALDGALLLESGTGVQKIYSGVLRHEL